MFKRTSILLGLVACLMLIVIGCSNQNNEGAGGSSQPNKAESNQGSSNTGGSDSAAADEKRTGGTFTIAVSADALMLGNPPTIMNQSDPDYAAPAVERLFRRDSQGLPVPYLAESYQVAADNLSITI